MNRKMRSVRAYPRTAARRRAWLQPARDRHRRHRDLRVAHHARDERLDGVPLRGHRARAAGRQPGREPADGAGARPRVLEDPARDAVHRPVDRSQPRHRLRGRRRGDLPPACVHGGQGRLDEPQLPDGIDRLLGAAGPELGHRRRDAGLPGRLHLALVRHEQLSGGGDGLSGHHAVQGHDLRHVDRRGHLVHGGAGRHDAEPVPLAERDASTPPPTRSRHRASRSSTARPSPRPASSRSRGPWPGSTSCEGPC